MKTQDEGADSSARARAERGGEGDVESAGETTAAAAIKGPDDTRPVGAGTKIEVGGGDEGEGDDAPPRH